MKSDVDSAGLIIDRLRSTGELDSLEYSNKKELFSQAVQPVHDAEWDYLIVLDACRYEIFKEEYQDYLSGDLKPVRSRGSATYQWLDHTFSGTRYNIDYVSTNCFANSSGWKLGELTDHIDSDWCAEDVFVDVDEAWKNIWSGSAGTVKADDLVDYCLNRDFERPTVIHFVQPHRPLLPIESSNNSSPDDIGNTTESLLSRTSLFWKPFFDLLSSSQKDKVRGFLGVDRESSLNYREFIEENGRDTVVEAYRENLRYALSNVSELVDKLDGKVVITSDHGEAFGENGDFGHPAFSENPVLREVPWLEVDNS